MLPIAISSFRIFDHGTSNYLLIERLVHLGSHAHPVQVGKCLLLPVSTVFFYPLLGLRDKPLGSMF